MKVGLKDMKKAYKNVKIEKIEVRLLHFVFGQFYFKFILTFLIENKMSLELYASMHPKLNVLI